MKDFLRKLRSYCSWHNLNPLNWSTAEIKLFVSAFFAIMLPIYIFIGLQPTPTANASSLPKLIISSINLNTPVETVELENRKLVAPATIAGVYHSAKNKIFIIGHSSTVFQNLNQVQTGEFFLYNDKFYQVQKTEQLAKADISMLEILQEEDQETIIIMTCAGTPLPNQDATHRFILTATRVAE